MAYEDNAKIMAERLKALREDIGLSRSELSSAIEDKCGVKISVDSITNYESSQDKYSSRQSSNNGMKNEFLHAFTDFYGVSSDYLLGLTDEPVKSANARAVCQYTGLSGKCVELLHSLDPDSLEANFIKRFFDDLLVHHEIHKSVVPSISHAVLANDIAARERNFTKQYKLIERSGSTKEVELSSSQQRIIDEQNGAPRLEEDGRYTVRADIASGMYLGEAIGTAHGSIDQVITELYEEFSRKNDLSTLTHEVLKSYRWKVYDDDPIEYFDKDVFNEFLVPNSEE